MLSPDENPYIDIRIAKQTIYGITWNGSPLRKTRPKLVHDSFRKYDSPKKEMTYIGPGINSYSVENLLPVTKYEVCVALKNHPPREGQCVVFVTGNDVSEVEKRERLIHIIVLVCAMGWRFGRDVRLHHGDEAGLRGEVYGLCKRRRRHGTCRRWRDKAPLTVCRRKQ
ncbi:hypothetical protein WMY93_010329 [Mugilogobius chulae]|uniref:Fibronectin type-III domain-containing protein n=1 Tax=Mugilogobius chulae TaxID=88201 RepID=A0AAW0P8B3_9GOBI